MAIEIKTISSEQEQTQRQQLLGLFRKNPIPEDEVLSNLGLFTKRQDFTKQLFFQQVYQLILHTHGVIMEFGVRWGQNLVTLNNLRGIFEPYNYSRKIIGFDTFSGFPKVDEKDGDHKIIKEGAFSVTEQYEEYLTKILQYHEKESPLAHIKKNFLVNGDAVHSLEKYLTDHPETIIAFAYFDFDIYEPTLKCLQLIKNYITRGTVIGFDELNDPQFPGETVALREAWGTSHVGLKRFSFCGIQSYFIVE